MKQPNTVNHFDSMAVQNEPLPYGVAKRVEELGSGSSGGESPIEHSPFTSPPVMSNTMDFPGLGEYAGYPDLNSMANTQPMAAQNMSSSMSMNGQQALSPGMQSSNGNIPRTPIRQNSGYAANMDFHHGLPMGVDGALDLPFR